MRFLTLLAAFCAAYLFQPLPAAHAFGDRAPPIVESVQLPATTHGQKILLLDQQEVVLKLAHTLLTDSRNRTVMDFAQQQANACWPIRLLPQLAWLETSPLHACGHAYAAALHHLFQQLLRTEGPRHPDLMRLERRFILPQAFTLCSLSQREFVTATVVYPFKGTRLWLLALFPLMLFSIYTLRRLRLVKSFTVRAPA